MPASQTFKRGTVELALLNILSESDMYGYEIMKETKKKSGGKFELALGTLYPIIYRFTEAGYITGRDELINGRLRKYYHLEPKGREYYNDLLAEYRRISEGIDAILNSSKN